MIFEKAAAKMKASGIENAEEIIFDFYKSLVEAVQETAIEGEGTEKIIATFAAPVLAGLATEATKAADLNKDGVIGN